VKGSILSLNPVAVNVDPLGPGTGIVAVGVEEVGALIFTIGTYSDQDGRIPRDEKKKIV